MCFVGFTITYFWGTAPYNKLMRKWIFSHIVLQWIVINFKISSVNQSILDARNSKKATKEKGNVSQRTSLISVYTLSSPVIKRKPLVKTISCIPIPAQQFPPLPIIHSPFIQELIHSLFYQLAYSMHNLIIIEHQSNHTTSTCRYSLITLGHNLWQWPS